MAVVFLDRLDDVQLAAILIILHPLHILAETQHHPGHHILHGGLLFGRKSHTSPDTAGLVKFYDKRILSITARRFGRFFSLPPVPLHLHHDFDPVHIIRVDFSQAFQFRQIFRADVAVKFKQGTMIIMVVALLLVQIGEFPPLHINKRNVHERRNISLRINVLEAAEITVEDLIEHRDVVDILHQCQAEELPGRLAPFHTAESQSLNRIEALPG